MELLQLNSRMTEANNLISSSYYKALDSEGTWFGWYSMNCTEDPQPVLCPPLRAVFVGVAINPYLPDRRKKKHPFTSELFGLILQWVVLTGCLCMGGGTLDK